MSVRDLGFAGVVGDAVWGVVVSLLACLIEAENIVTQVLSCKFRDANAQFNATGAKVATNPDAVTALGPAIRARLRA